jgi:hypothetical protein
MRAIRSADTVGQQQPLFKRGEAIHPARRLQERRRLSLLMRMLGDGSVAGRCGAGHLEVDV